MSDAIINQFEAQRKKVDVDNFDVTVRELVRIVQSGGCVLRSQEAAGKQGSDLIFNSGLFGNKKPRNAGLFIAE